MKIPSNNIWTQTNEGDTLGVLHSTRNITLETPGKAKLAKKTVTLLTPNLPNPTTLEYGLAIVYFNNQYVVVHPDDATGFDLEGGVIDELPGTNPTPTIYGDALVFNGLLLVTTNNNLSSHNGSAWTNSLESNTANYPHPMEIFDSLTTYKLAIGNVNTVKLLDTSYNNSTAVLTLPNQFVVTTLAYSNGYMYVGTRNTNGGDTKIFIWDGNGNNANYEVPVSGNWVYSLKPYMGTVCGILSSGELIQVNGSSAQRLAALPVFYNPLVRWQNSLDGDVPRVFNRGMITDGSTVYINVNALVESGLQSDYLPGFESGIWKFEPQNGLYHFASANYLDVQVIDAALSVTDSVITTAAAHNLKTGDSVVFSSVSGLSGVDTSTIYYVDVLSTTTIKLALSRRLLKDGSYVTITGTAGASDKLVYTPNREYFQYGRVSSGAIAKPTANDSYFKNWSTPIIWASSGQDQDLQSRSYAINILSDAYNVGTIETQRVYTNNLEESWKKLHSFIDGLDLDNEEVIVKYRTEEEYGYPTPAYLGTWLTANTLNIDLSDCSYIKEGDEMTIIDGYGRGLSAHVTSVVNTSTVSSITIDEAHGLANQKARVSFTNYKKATIHDPDTKVKGVLSTSIDKQSPWVQVKVEMRGFGTTVDHFDLSHVVQKQPQ